MSDNLRSALDLANFAALIGVAAFFLTWEAGDPRFAFPHASARWRHVARNAGLLAVFGLASAVLLTVIVPSLTLFDAQQGLLSGLPRPLQVVLGVLILDIFQYAWHRLCHRVPWLWRLHRVHHADPHLDVSTGARFHPIEAILGLIAKVAILAVLGLPIWIEGVRILFSNPLALAQHANVAFPDWLERWPRWLIVTPGLHRVHHSTNPDHYDRNFGETLSVWDRLFGTYDAPSARITGVGLQDVQDERHQTLPGMLAMPWREVTSATVRAAR
ncbi:MAG: sterol desaturase family protein [Casimicrobiaceae bacterium]